MCLLILIPLITFDDRQARGEDLQGLNLEELQQLEKKLEAGLRRVLETKVCARLLISPAGYIYIYIGKKTQNQWLWLMVCIVIELVSLV